MCNNVFDFDEMIGSSRLGFRVIACEKKIKNRRQKRERKNDEKQVQGRGNQNIFLASPRDDTQPRVARSFIAMKCTYVAFMQRVTRGTRTCFSQGCQFQPLAQPAKEDPVQLIKQKDAGGGVRGGLENAANEGNGLATLPFGLLSPYHPDRKNNQESASSRNTSILYRRDYL